MRALFPLAALVLAGCVATPQGLPPAASEALALVDDALYAEVRTTEEVTATMEGWAAQHPSLVRVESIGQSRNGLDIMAAFIGAADAPAAAVLDGGHHANEVAGVETVLYLGDFLLANLGNATVQRILASTEVVLVPVVNPDGHSASPRTRGNALGVNLNRNYDVDWGHPLGGENRAVGIVVGETGVPVPAAGGPFLENPGEAPFSEPEARAIRDLLARLGPRLAFYLTMHTNAHSFSAPWAAFDPPREVPPEHGAVFEAAMAWVDANTEFEVGYASWGDFSANLPYSASGTSMDWAYYNHSIPSFLLETECCGLTYEPAKQMRQNGPYEGVPYWMKAGLPVTTFLLANAQRLQAWELPTESLALPAGVPPEPPA